MSQGRSPVRLSVVLSTLGNYETLRRVLDGYDRQTAGADSFEVVVAMDAADPDPGAVRAAIGTRRYHVNLIQGARPGLSENRNAGYRAAAAPIVLFTDNDTIPVRRLVAEHVSWHEQHPDDATGVLGRVRWANELRVTTFMRWLDTGIQFDFANIKGTEAGWGRFAGANVSLKRAFIVRVGDFDQEHFPYGYEDTDWAYRASKLGFRLLYNRDAVVDHLRPMTLEFWQKRARRVAASERTYTALHPETEPWFYTRFKAANAAPRARGRGIRLAPFIPRWVPWLGPRVWGSVHMYYMQALAPSFLEAWEEADHIGARPAGPDLSEFAD
jgi:GT2 family glycosyltransferase